MRLSSILLLCVLSAGCGKPEKSEFKPSSGAHTVGVNRTVTTAAFSPDGKSVLVLYNIHDGTNDKNLRLYDVATGKEVWAAKGPHGMIRFSPDGKFIKMVSKGKISSLATKNGTEIDTIVLNQLPVAFTDDLSLAITAESDTDFTLSLYDVNKNQPIRKLTKSTTGISSIRFSPDKRHVLFAFPPARDNQLLLFVMMDLTTGNTLWSLKGHNNENDIGIFSPNGEQVIVSGREDNDEPLKKKLYLKDTLTGNTIRTFDGHSAGIQAIVFTPDGQSVYAVSKDGVLKKWHVDSGNEEWTLSIPNGFVRFSPDAKKVFTAYGHDGTDSLTAASTNIKLKIWDLEKRKLQWSFP